MCPSSTRTDTGAVTTVVAPTRPRSPIRRDIAGWRSTPITSGDFGHERHSTIRPMKGAFLMSPSHIHYTLGLLGLSFQTGERDSLTIVAPVGYFSDHLPEALRRIAIDFERNSPSPDEGHDAVMPTYATFIERNEWEGETW